MINDVYMFNRNNLLTINVLIFYCIRYCLKNVNENKLYGYVFKNYVSSFKSVRIQLITILLNFKKKNKLKSLGCY